MRDEDGKVVHDEDGYPVTCLDESEQCRGPIRYHAVGASLRAWPRCDFHAERRWESYENSMERYADSDVAPEWFDASYAGEEW